MKLTIEIKREPNSEKWLVQWQMSGSTLTHSATFDTRDEAQAHATTLFQEADPT
jgi:hypothetical protein